MDLKLLKYYLRCLCQKDLWTGHRQKQRWCLLLVAAAAVAVVADFVVVAQRRQKDLGSPSLPVLSALVLRLMC